METKHYDISLFRQYSNIVVGTSNLFQEKEPASHDFFMVVYMACGNAKLEIMEQEYTIYEGDVLLVRPNVQYALYDKYIRNALYYCGFYPAAVGEFFGQLKLAFSELSDFFEGHIPFIRMPGGNSKKVRDYMVSMVDDYMHVQVLCEYTIKSKLILCLTEVCRESAYATRQEKISCANKGLDYVILHIKRNIYRKMTLDELANIMFISKEYLCRLFKKHIGMTVTQFINLQRVEIIKDRLANTDRSISTIHDDFEMNADYLNQIFREIAGCTMLEYRAKYHFKTGKDKERRKEASDKR